MLNKGPFWWNVNMCELPQQQLNPHIQSIMSHEDGQCTYLWTFLLCSAEYKTRFSLTNLLGLLCLVTTWKKNKGREMLHFNNKKQQKRLKFGKYWQQCNWEILLTFHCTQCQTVGYSILLVAIAHFLVYCSGTMSTIQKLAPKMSRITCNPF